MIHVCYAIHDRDERYSKFTGTSMLSMFENISAAPPSITVHILHDNTLTQKNYENFIYIAGKYGQIVKFYNVERICADKIQFLQDKMAMYINSRFSIGAFYRLFVNKNFFRNDNVPRMIYLDSDTIVNLDIAELWNYPMMNYMVASVPEFQATRGYMVRDKHLLNSGIIGMENYFCSGVMMIDIDKLEENFFYDGINWLAENSKCECPDQDILNYFFSTNYCKLPEKFDAFVGVAKMLDNNTLAKKIYHYSGLSLGLDMQNAYDKLFFSYFTKTSWFNTDFIEHTYQAMRQIYVEQKNFAVQISAAISGRERAFFIMPKDIETAKKILNIRKGEEIIPADSNEAIGKLIKKMKKSDGKKIYFTLISTPGFDEFLTKEGFVAGKDFINAMTLLSDAYGVPMPTQGVVRFL